MKRCYYLFPLLLLSSCVVFKSHEQRSAQKIQRAVARSEVFSQAFTGFTLLDPATGKTLANFNGDRYFTPASNVKIFTLATCMEVLGDSVPGLRASTYKDGVETIHYLQPTGDPTFLHPFFVQWQPVFDFLRNCQGSADLDLTIFRDSRFGAGWAWDDFNEAYSAERSAMPIYGNMMTLTKRGDTLKLLPIDYADGWGCDLIQYGTPKDLPSYRKPIRLLDGNGVFISNGQKLPENYTASIPFFRPNDYLYNILKDTTGKSNISTIWEFTKERDAEAQRFMPKNLQLHTIYSTPLDTVLRRMMHQSDNFIAEQMLLVCAGVKFGLLRQDTMIRWALDSIFQNIPQKPRWVDGSGLSRYNLASPQSIAQVLQSLWNRFPHERVLSLFPAGGQSGTIADWYAGERGKPYVFAKTGSMSGVHCLSGYVVCRSGKVLVFSFMHNNFIGSNRVWKVEMQRILEKISHDF